MTQDQTRREVEDLHLIHLTKQFGEAKAVDDLNLTFPAGSFFALLGPSGCGKTTTLRMVAGLEEPTAGSVLIGENDVTTKRPYERPVNTVFQSYALFPHMDIFENVAFGLRRRGVKDLDGQVQQMLALVELEQMSRRKPAQLSGGQQQRVALARALINQPDVLLLDEPLGALDLKLRRQMQIELKSIQVEVGITFIHVTHDQEEAMTMADTVAVMNHGRIEQMGAPAEIYDRPASVFVANFLGQSNLIPSTVVTSDSDNLVVEGFGQRWALPKQRSATDGPEVVLGVRPEKTRIRRLSDAGGESGLNRVEGVVTDASFTGLSTQFLVRANWGAEYQCFEQNLHMEDPIRRGDRVELVWDPIHSFGLDASQGIEAGLDSDVVEMATGRIAETAVGS